jgi:hypothetical protein
LDNQILSFDISSIKLPTVQQQKLINFYSVADTKGLRLRREHHTHKDCDEQYSEIF